MEGKTEIILGPPGTGKTTTLINLLSEALARGVPSNKIGFLSFTKQATEEARNRAMARFNLTSEDLPYFRTLHSLAFRQLGMRPAQVMSRRHYKELGRALGIEIGGYSNQEEGDAYGLPTGDRLLFLSGLARVRCLPLREVWEECGEDLDWWEVEKFDRALRSYKDCHSLSDFTDMLSTFEEKGSYPELDVLFIDEAQDLSQLQWRIVAKLIQKSKVVYIAGDDDQAIYRWSGADVDTFIGYPGKSRVLDQSYRIPATVHRLSEAILSGMGKRRGKTFRPAIHAGSVTYECSPDDVDISQGLWLLLVRNGYQAKALEDRCREEGYHYESKGQSPAKGEALDVVRFYERARNGESLTPDQTSVVNKYRSKHAPGGPWYESLDRLHPDDRDYFRSALRRGERITGPARIRISTIHGAKGGEADNVMLCTDMSYKTFEGYQKNPDDEARVFYVGATRAKKNLHIVQPQTNRYFEI